ncbi:MAG: 30S ribosome-binding factor RbfA [Actinomycetota bacterium]|nr:30S ribosome-binding factor RbfA [Actinomycetota bacterium]
MTDGARPNRVAEELREVLAGEIPKLKDPRVGFVTVTAVRVTPDLRRAVVSYTALGDDAERRATAAGLRSARARLRSVLGKEVRIKFTPELVFEEDHTVEEASRVDELIAKLHREEAP